MVHYTLFYCNLKTLQSKVRIVAKIKNCKRKGNVRYMKKRIYSKWSKDIKKAMIDRDLTTKDIADKFHWTTQYASSIINGRKYYREPVANISVFLNVPIPKGKNATLSKEIEELIHEF